jgi:hypothetical protein
VGFVNHFLTTASWRVCLVVGGLVALDLSLGWWWPTGKTWLDERWRVSGRRIIEIAIIVVLLLISTVESYRNRYDEGEIIGSYAVTSACPAAPGPAQRANYCANTLNSTVFSPATIDFDLTKATGFTWYFYDWGQTAQPENTVSNGSSVVVGESSGGFQATLSSATSLATRPFFRGTAYGGGGYFEVTASFAAVNNPAAATWEAPLWTAAIEGPMRRGSYQWSGQTLGPPPYGHYFEGDVMEYFQGRFSSPLDQYSASSHDWWGQNNVDDHFSAHRVSVNPASFYNPHRYGMLWVPATSSKKGGVCYYFDRALEGCDTYTQFTNNGLQAPPPTGRPWLYGVIDSDHLLLVMGCTNADPCTIRSVQVWQSSAARNLSN